MGEANLNRTKILRRDCPRCKGNGYIEGPGGQEVCPEEGGCGGSGLLEKEVPYKFETEGRLEPEEIAEAWELPADQIIDKGHAEQDKKIPGLNDDE